LSDEYKDKSGIDEKLLFSSEYDLDGALRKVIINILILSNFVKIFLL